LAAKGMTVSLVNPAQIRSFAKGMAVLSKTDKIDAVLLARYGCLAQPKAWTPPAEHLIQLQALLARLDDLEGDLRREQNRYEQACVRGCSGAIKHSFVTSIRTLKAQCKRLQQAIAEHFAAHEDLQADLERLQTIPAVGPKTAMWMLALLRSHSFETARQVAAFLGLVPIERQSGRSVRGRPRLSKAGNPRLRAALYMAAVVATKLNPDIRAQQQRLLARGKAKMSTLGAAMRKLVHICFGVLKSRDDYRFRGRSPDLTAQTVSTSRSEVAGCISTGPSTATATPSSSGSASDVI
jgi:transposase